MTLQWALTLQYWESYLTVNVYCRMSQEAYEEELLASEMKVMSAVPTARTTAEKNWPSRRHQLN